MRQPLMLSAALMMLAAPAAAQHENHQGHAATAPSAALAAAVAAPTRTEANRARDRYRNPAPTLAFFGVEADDTVVELSPGGGWYTEILAPYLKDKGTLYLAQAPGNALNNLKTKLAADATTYGKVKFADIPLTSATVPDGSADVVLTFRNVHNWVMNADPAMADNVFSGAFRALKPGGVLGVVEHRLPEDRDSAQEKKSGYIKRSTVIALAQKAGFKLASESEINANPKDKADYPNGVWTLPPNLRDGEVNQEKYIAIGESDRMTLKFVKPAA